MLTELLRAINNNTCNIIDLSKQTLPDFARSSQSIIMSSSAQVFSKLVVVNDQYVAMIAPRNNKILFKNMRESDSKYTETEKLNKRITGLDVLQRSDYRVVSLSTDNVLRVWDVRTAKCIYKVEIDTQPRSWLESKATMISCSQNEVAISKGKIIQIWGLGNKLIEVKKLPTFEKTSAEVTALATKEDLFVIGLNDGIISLVDLREKKTSTIRPHTKAILDIIVISVKSKVIAAAYSDNVVLGFDFVKLQPLFLFKHGANVLALCNLSDGYFISTSKDKTVKVWNAYSGQCVHTLTGHSEEINALATFADGSFLTGSGVTLRHWKFPQRNLKIEDIKTLLQELKTNTSVTALKLDNCHLFDFGIVELVKLLIINKTLTELSLQNCEITEAGYKLLIAGLKFNSMIKVLNIANNPINPIALKTLTEKIMLLNKNIRVITNNSLENISNRETVVSEIKTISNDRLEKQEEKYTNQKLGDKNTLLSDPFQLQYHVDLRYLLDKKVIDLSEEVLFEYNRDTSMEDDASLKIIASAHYRNSFRFPIITCFPYRHRFAGSNGSVVTISDTTNMQPISIIDEGQRFVILASSFDRYLAGATLSFSIGQEESIYVWDTNVSPVKRICVIPTKASLIRTLEFLLNNQLAYVRGENRNEVIEIWDVIGSKEPKIVKTFIALGEENTGESILMLRALPNYQLAGSLNSNTIKIWDIASGACLHTLCGHADSIHALAALSGNILASAGKDKRIILWDVRHGNCVTTLNDHKDAVNMLITSPDGSLISGSGKDNKTSIRVLTPRPRPIERKDVLFLFKSLEENDTAMSLKLDNYFLDDMSFNGLIQMLTRNRRLTELSLVNCNISNKYCDLLLNQLNVNRSIQSIDISNNPVDAELLNKLQRKLHDNKQLNRNDINMNVGADEKNNDEKMYYLLKEMNSSRNQIYGSDVNKVTVRAWLNTSFGHVSVQTYGPDGIYASFWPGGCKKENACVKTDSHNHTFREDKLIEEIPPDTEINLYTLDVKTINNVFNVFKRSNSNWALLGSSFLRKEEQRNCSGLAMFLLEKAGVASLLPDPKFDEKGERVGKFLGTGFNFVGIIFAIITRNEAMYDLTAPVTASASTAIASSTGKMVGHAINSGVHPMPNVVITPRDVVKVAKIAARTEQKKYEIILESSPNKFDLCGLKIKLKIFGFFNRGMLAATALVSQDFKNHSYILQPPAIGTLITKLNTYIGDVIHWKHHKQHAEKMVKYLKSNFLTVQETIKYLQEQKDFLLQEKKLKLTGSFAELLENSINELKNHIDSVPKSRYEGIYCSLSKENSKIFPSDEKSSNLSNTSGEKKHESSKQATENLKKFGIHKLPDSAAPSIEIISSADDNAHSTAPIPSSSNKSGIT